MTDTSKDNPFAEADDGTHTVIRPRLGRAPAPPRAEAYPTETEPRAAVAPVPASPPHGGDETHVAPRPIRRRQAPLPVADADITPDGATDPLLAAAAPLLQLLARLRNTLTPPDSGDLRERAAQALRAFEQRARADGVPEEQLRPAHYALCASLDDVVLNTPWGSNGPWAGRSLASSLHNEVRGGEHFFVLLLRMRQHPAKFRPVLELMYLCLSLGFMGRYRLSPRGPAEVDQLREELYALVAAARPRGDADLSPAWRGVAAPYRPRRWHLPLWVVAVAGIAVTAGLFAWQSLELNAASDTLYVEATKLPPTAMPDIVRAAPAQPVRQAPAEAGVQDRLRQFLRPEIDAALVTIAGTQGTPVIRISQASMFALGSAGVAPASAPLLERIGAALKPEAGTVQVIGYTDDQPIRTVRFPSNYQLSAARAEAAGAVIAHGIGDAGRLRTEGRASADPIAPNTTPEGRAANRRIEIVLRRQA